jgi:hypothetical protein
MFFDQQFGKVRQLDRQKPAVPAGVVANLIVGKGQGALLSLGESDELDSRYLRDVETLRRFKRPYPPIRVSVSSTSTGAPKPKALMLSAICRICACEWVRALRGLALISWIDNRRSMRRLVTIAFSPAMWLTGQT